MYDFDGYFPDVLLVHRLHNRSDDIAFGRFVRFQGHSDKAKDVRRDLNSQKSVMKWHKSFLKFDFLWLLSAIKCHEMAQVVLDN